MTLARTVLCAPARPTPAPIAFVALAVLAALVTLALPRRALADEVPPSCTTTTTCTTQTTCSGTAAPLALQPPTVQVLPPAAPAPPQPYAPPPQPYAPPSAYAPAPDCPQPPVYAPPPPPPPPGYYAQPYLPQYRLVEKEERMAGLAIAGGAMFGATWIPMAMVGFVAGEGRFAVPIAGPMFAAGEVRDGQLQALLVAEGLTQAAGLTMFIAGLATTRKVKVREPIAVVPSFTSTGAGLTAMGRF